jgi:hypothetical protein
MSVLEGIAAAESDIARVARQIWESEGRPEGRDKEHWQRAREILEREEEGPDLGDLRQEPGGGFAKALSEGKAPTHDALTPGPRDPAPLPAANADGHVAIPDAEDEAAGVASPDQRG